MADDRFKGQGLKRIYTGMGLSPYGMRADGSAPKGKGYFGEIPNNRGANMTEYSMSVELNGREQEIPLIVPTLTSKDIEILKDVDNIGQVPQQIKQKAIKHAVSRLREGKSPFAGATELRLPLPNDQDLKSKIKKKMMRDRNG